MKIAIITLNGYFNYGNRLQNYALQEFLKINGDNVETLRFNRFKNETSSFKKTLSYIKKNIIKKNETSIERQRNLIFRDFSNGYINESSDIYDVNQDLYFLKNQFDYFIIGSDQVWNPSMNAESPAFFAQFADEKQRVSYSASFGVSELDKTVFEKYSKWLQTIPNISVRERDGASLIKNMTGREVPVLSDPTMLLTKKEWLSISKQAINRPESPYLLTYFLGGPTDDTRKKLEKLAKEKNMTIINLGDITERETYETGPSEFLDYINNASAFFTDSFHGVVFSIIFETPFVVYERQSSGPSMYSRIETILDKFDMRDREAEGFDQDIFSMDFSGTHEVLEREYNKSIDYLKEALRIEG